MFQMLNYVFLFVAVTMLFPLLQLLAVSLSSPVVADSKEVFPARGVYNRILGACIKNKGLWTSFGITVYITIAGTLLSMLFSVMTAYPLSRREFLIRKQVMFGIVLTMIFNAPMIPFFDRSRAWHDEFPVGAHYSRPGWDV